MPIPRAAPGTVDALAAEFLSLFERHRPTAASSIGLYDHAARLPEPTEAAAQAYLREVEALTARVAAFDAGDDVEAAVDRDGLSARLAAERLATTHQPAHRVNPMALVLAVVEGVFQLLARDHLPDAVRVAGLRGRCAATPAYLDTARASLEPRSVPPRWAAMAEATASGASGLLRDVIPTAVPAVAEDAVRAGEAMAGFAGWLADEVVPVAAGDPALGEAATAELLTQAHALDTTPAEVAAVGEELCARTDARLAEAAGRDDWQVALAQVKAHHPGHDELTGAYQAAFAEMSAACLDADVVTDPGVDAVVEATPPFLRSLLTYAAYFGPGEFEGDGGHAHGQGRLWVTPPAAPDGLADHSYASIPSIVAHEGYPGHHLQITGVARNPGIMRRLRVSTLMTEGWGLYCEELMAELGAYDAAARLAQLSLTKLRAVRIVVDMGLHAGDLTEEQAAQRMVDDAGLSPEVARAEVGRYTMTPGQPFTYLYGAEQIRELRTAWRARTGGSLRAFHDTLLAYGHLPPALAARALS